MRKYLTLIALSAVASASFASEDIPDPQSIYDIPNISEVVESNVSESQKEKHASPSRRAILSGFISHHDRPPKGYIKKKKEYNEDNYGIGYRNEDGYMIGYYKNSFHDNSFYFGREFKYKLNSYVSAGVVLGGVTGYKYSLVPFVLPELILENNYGELVFAVTPGKVIRDTPTTYVTQLRIKF